MAIERNNTALEFETMLRRHLKSGGAPVAACAGFEVDSASAYLEDGLGKSARAHYESHLAGCAACRRHLIELARLSQLAPQPETQPVAVANQAPVWVRWKAAVAGWFDFSVWNWKWPTIGAAGTISAVLVAALSAQVWRQIPKPAADSASVAARSSPDNSLSVTAPSPSPEASRPIAGESTVAYSSDEARSRADLRVPKPVVDPQRNEKEIAVVPSDKSLNLAAGQADSQFDFSARRSAASPEAPQRRTAMAQSLAAPAPQSVPVGGNERAEHQVAVKLDDRSQAEAVIVTDGGARADLTTRIAAPPEYNPMISVTEKPQTRSKPQNGKAELQPAKSKWRERVMGFLPDHKPEPERKTPLNPDDDESLKPLTVRIRDKVFRFEQNMWIDQAYRPEVARWRVTRLVRGSKEFERVLADDPQLKEFFDQGPIIIVWKDK
ncbi:MAG: hypothetical protein ACRD9Y_05800, partial [Blastocatellia bacterium]